MPVFEDLARRLRGRRGILVDSNIFIDIASKNQEWAGWSKSALDECSERAIFYINPIIYVEISVGYESLDALNHALPSQVYQREQLPWEAGFLAGKAFSAYRRKGGPRTSLLPDFYIGAHAAIGNLALLTRDAARFHSYFPRLEILSPRRKS
jgi:predicted nucleic acid-binding protein